THRDDRRQGREIFQYYLLTFFGGWREARWRQIRPGILCRRRSRRQEASPGAHREHGLRTRGRRPAPKRSQPRADGNADHLVWPHGQTRDPDRARLAAPISDVALEGQGGSECEAPTLKVFRQSERFLRVE